MVTQLMRCDECGLLFRVPTTSVGENAKYYQARYRQGFTTDMPEADELARLLETKFTGTEKDYSRFDGIFAALGVNKGARIFDFGCSWGYGSWQLRRFGYEVESYEISRPRADYARERLGCHVVSDLPEVKSGFDVFFSSHVLEHVPSIRDAIDFAMSILRPGGLFVAFTPNGSSAFREQSPSNWQKLWGLVHPNFLDEEYYRRQFSDQAYLLASDPYDLEAIGAWGARRDEQRVLQLAGEELMCAVRVGGQEQAGI